MLWQAALRRSRIPQERRHPVMVLIDEVQDYLRLHGDIGDALAQARSLGVGFTLAHQHLSQLPTALRSAVLANARSRVCFQLSHEDAAALAKGSGLTSEDFASLPAFQAYAAVLVGGTPTPYGSIVTQPLPPASSDPEAIRRRSRDRYGRPLSEVEAAWLEIAVREHPAGGLGRREIGGGG